MFCLYFLNDDYRHEKLQFMLSSFFFGLTSVYTVIKDSRCFLDQGTLPSLLSTGWFQEWIGLWFSPSNLKKLKACWGFTFK